jgi:hypothetical protein
MWEHWRMIVTEDFQRDSTDSKDHDLSASPLTHYTTEKETLELLYQKHFNSESNKPLWF